MDPELKSYLDAWQAERQRDFKVIMANLDALQQSMILTSDCLSRTSDCFFAPVTASSGATKLATASAREAQHPAPVPAIGEPLAVAPAAPMNTIAVTSASCSTKCAAQATPASSTELAHDKDAVEHRICDNSNPSPTAELVLARTDACPASLTNIIVVAPVAYSTEYPSRDANELTPASTPAATPMSTGTVDVILVLAAIAASEETFDDEAIKGAAPMVAHDAHPVCIEMVPVTCSTECSTQVVAIASVDEVHDTATTVCFKPAVDLIHQEIEQFRPVHTTPSVGTNTTSTAEVVTPVATITDVDPKAGLQELDASPLPSIKYGTHHVAKSTTRCLPPEPWPPPLRLWIRHMGHLFKPGQWPSLKYDSVAGYPEEPCSGANMQSGHPPDRATADANQSKQASYLFGAVENATVQTAPILSVLVRQNVQLTATLKLPDKMCEHVDVDFVALLQLDTGADLRPPWPPPEFEVLCSIDIHSSQLTNAGFAVSPSPERLITEIPMNALVTCSVLEVHQSGYAPSFLRTYLVKEENQRATCLCEVILSIIPYGPDYFRWEIAWFTVSACAHTKLGGSVSLTMSDSLSSTNKWQSWRHNSFSNWSCFGVGWWNDIFLQDWLITWSMGHNTQGSLELFQWKITGSGCSEIASTEFKTNLLPSVVSSVPVYGQTGPAEVCTIELGGTVGDMETMPFIEALHQLSFSLVEALLHSSVTCSLKPCIQWVVASDLDDAAITSAPDAHAKIWKILKGSSCILKPAEIGDRGIHGLIWVAKYARENTVLYLGICLGMQLSVIEVSRIILALGDAYIKEFNADTPDRVVIFIPEVSVIIYPELWIQSGNTIRLIWSSKLMELIRGCEKCAQVLRHRPQLHCDSDKIRRSHVPWDPGGSPGHWWFPTCRDQEPFQGGRNGIAVTAFYGQVLADRKYYFNFGQVHPIDNYYLGAPSDWVPVSHDYFSYLVEAYPNLGCYRESDQIKDRRLQWDPGGFSMMSAWGQAEFQGGRDVRTPAWYLMLGCCQLMLGCCHGLAPMGQDPSLLILSRRQRRNHPEDHGNGGGGSFSPT